jgi:hypothetical protein
LRSLGEELGEETQFPYTAFRRGGGGVEFRVERAGEFGHVLFVESSNHG